MNQKIVLTRRGCLPEAFGFNKGLPAAHAKEIPYESPKVVGVNFPLLLLTLKSVIADQQIDSRTGVRLWGCVPRFRLSQTDDDDDIGSTAITLVTTNACTACEHCHKMPSSRRLTVAVHTQHSSVNKY